MDGALASCNRFFLGMYLGTESSHQAPSKICQLALFFISLVPLHWNICCTWFDITSLAQWVFDLSQCRGPLALSVPTYWMVPIFIKISRLHCPHKWNILVGQSAPLQCRSVSEGILMCFIRQFSCSPWCWSCTNRFPSLSLSVSFIAIPLAALFLIHVT